jgi:hypothetical protein
MAIHGAGAQDTAVYRPPVAVPTRPAKYIYLIAPVGSVPVGATYRGHAEVFDSVNNRFHPTIHWRSSDTTVASVGAMGEANVPLTGRRAGRTVITAYTDSLTKSIVVFVGPVPAVARIDIVPLRATLGVGETIRFLAVVRDDRGRSLPQTFLSWSWSDSAVVEFFGTTDAKELLLRGARDGEVSVFADLRGRSAEANLVVGAGGRSPRVRSIVLSPADTSLNVGDDIEFTASLFGDGDVALSGRLVRWSVCDTTILHTWTFIPTQSTHITYRALRAGTCAVTASAGGVRRASRVVIRRDR